MIKIFNKVLVLWLDAYSNRFLQYPEAKFIKSLAEENVFKLLKPIFAYKGIGYSIFTGASVNKHRVWMEHSYRKNNLHPTPLKEIIRLSSIIPNDYIQKAARLILYKAWRAYYGTPHLIPAKYLDYFTQVKPNPIPTLFDTLRANKITYHYSEPKTSFGETLLFRSLPSLVSHYDLVYAKFNSLDRLGHMFGPLNWKVKNRVKWLDAMLNCSINQICRENKNTLFLIFSDHGMTPIRTIVDMESILAKTQLKVLKDYVAFEGSTYWSFFFLNKSAREIIEKDLVKISGGKLVTPEEIETKWSIPAGVAKKFGDAFFVLNEGHIVFPDFYRRQTPPKGMHGYFDAKWDSPIFIMTGQNYKQKKYDYIEFEDIVPTIYRALGITIPIWCDGSPLQLG